MKKSLISLIFFSFANLYAYTVAIVPQFTPTVIEQLWSPTIRALESASGEKLTIKYYKTITEFEKALARGEVDFAYMNPYHIVMFKNKYEPIIKDGKEKLSGFLVVRNNSKYKSVKDLKGQKIAFPSPNAFAASLLIRAQLKFVEKIDFEPVYVNTHTNVYKYVVLGETEAGGGVNKTLAKEYLDVKSSLRILYRTPESSPHPFCANKRVPKSVVSKIQNAFLKLASQDEASQKALAAIEISQPTTANYKTDYAHLEKLNISTLAVLE